MHTPALRARCINRQRAILSKLIPSSGSRIEARLYYRKRTSREPSESLPSRFRGMCCDSIDYIILHLHILRNILEGVGRLHYAWEVMFSFMRVLRDLWDFENIYGGFDNLLKIYKVLRIHWNSWDFSTNHFDIYLFNKILYIYIYLLISSFTSQIFSVLFVLSRRIKIKEKLI